MSPRRPTSAHAGARRTATGGARGVPSPRGAGRADRRTPAAGAPAAGAAARPGRSAGARSGERGPSTRPASRTQPAVARAGGATAVEPPVRIPRMFTVRALVLFVVLLLAFVLLFPTVRAHLAQRAENARLAAEVASARERTEDLAAQLERWDDPAYVVAQARERLAFVRPGETAYRVVDPETVPDPTAPAVPDAGTGPTLVPAGSTSPWYTTIWESVRVAGEAEVAPAGDGSPGTAPPIPTPTPAAPGAAAEVPAP